MPLLCIMLILTCIYMIVLLFNKWFLAVPFVILALICAYGLVLIAVGGSNISDPTVVKGSEILGDFLIPTLIALVFGKIFDLDL